MFRRSALLAFVVAIVVLAAHPASAVHLFPLFPGDPTGDCAAKMKEPKDAAAHVVTEGFFFVDEQDGLSTTTIRKGQSVMWEFVRFCHSVTSVSVPKGAKKFSTFGGKGSAKGPVAGQDQLVKPDGEKSNYTVKFKVPGTYRYACVHHAAVGMTGTIEVLR
jgi:plastocyanin